MVTTDITINDDGNWHEIQSGQLCLWITQVKFNNVLVRVGPGDTSDGFELFDGPVHVKSDVNLFVKFNRGDSSDVRTKSVITVVTV